MNDLSLEVQQTKNLMTLRDRLREVNPDRFSMEHFIDLGIHGTIQLFREEKCGTACAIGYCPIFFPDDWCYGGGNFPELKLNPGKPSYHYTEEFFGISRYEHDELFMPMGYCQSHVLPTDVADKIDQLIEDRLES